MTAAIYEQGGGDRGMSSGASRRDAGVRAWCEVDLHAIRANLAALRARAAVPLVPMVKADAYGLGVEPVARSLGAPFNSPNAAWDNAHVEAPWALGIATIEEAEHLRALGASGRLLCTTPLLPDELPSAAHAHVTPALHREADIRRWRQLTAAPWHLAIDTGMQRAGVSWRDIEPLKTVMAEHAPEGVFTHFHSADRPNGTFEVQESRFRAALSALAMPGGTLRHADNSWSLVARAPSAWDLARPGIALYGVPVSDDLALRQVVHVRARIVDLRDVAAGDTVSYDATWTADVPRRVATVAIGYGDGYRRALSNRGCMLLHGRQVPVLGLVTMDMTMLDVTDLSCEIGDVVTAVGSALGHDATLSLEDVAAMGGVSPYELLVGWRLRLPRVYLP